MDFAWTEEQTLLYGTVLRAVGDVPQARRRAGERALVWARLCEAGLPSLAVPEALGGLGGDAALIMAAMEAAGWSLAGAPLAGSVVTALGLFGHFAADGLVRTMLPDLLRGSARLCLVPPSPEAGEPGLRQEAGGIWGQSGLVVDAGDATHFLLAFAQGEDMRVAVVPANAAGIRRVPCRIVDGSEAAEISFSGCDPGLHGVLHCGKAETDDAVLQGMVAACGEMLGLMCRLFDETLTYARTRSQFGAKIGSFQVIAHRLARLRVTQEQARSWLLRAVLTPKRDGTAWRHAVHGAHAYIADAALQMGHEAMQIHGGIGMTDELVIGHAHKRVMVLSRMFITAAKAREKYEAYSADRLGGACAA